LPREVFFGRLGFVSVFFEVFASNFERFFPAASSSFPVFPPECTLATEAPPGR